MVFVLAVASALVISFLCSISEATLLTVRYAHIEALGKSRAGIILRQFKDEIDRPIAAILVLNTVAHTIGASVAGATYSEVFDESTLWIFTLVFTTAILVFTEIVPKTLGVAAAESLAAPVALGVHALTLVLAPILAVTRRISGLLRRGDEAPATSLEEIRLLASLGRTEGAVAATTAEIIEGAAQLRELRVRDVMVPSGGVIFLSGRLSLEQNVAMARRSGHSRFPFTPTGDLNDATGIVLVKDLLFTLHDGTDAVDWNQLVSSPVVVPTSTTLESLLRTFQEQRKHLALVVDEYGTTRGIVTMEDVLEELVGEIEDETDRINPFMNKRRDGSLLVRGWAELRKVLSLFGRDVEAAEEVSDAVSVGGFVAELVGRVPRTGDVTEWDGLRFTVTQASPRRAERIEIRETDPAPTDPA